MGELNSFMREAIDNILGRSLGEPIMRYIEVYELYIKLGLSLLMLITLYGIIRIGYTKRVVRKEGDRRNIRDYKSIRRSFYIGILLSSLMFVMITYVTRPTLETAELQRDEETGEYYIELTKEVEEDLYVNYEGLWESEEARYVLEESEVYEEEELKIYLYMKMYKEGYENQETIDKIGKIYDIKYLSKGNIEDTLVMLIENEYGESYKIGESLSKEEEAGNKEIEERILGAGGYQKEVSVRVPSKKLGAYPIRYMLWLLILEVVFLLHQIIVIMRCGDMTALLTHKTFEEIEEEVESYYKRVSRERKQRESYYKEEESELEARHQRELNELKEQQEYEKRKLKREQIEDREEIEETQTKEAPYGAEYDYDYRPEKEERAYILKEDVEKTKLNVEVLKDCEKLIKELTEAREKETN